MKRRFIAGAAFACVALAAHAQAIYRCGNTYSAQACPGATSVEPAKAPSAADADASRRETEREMKVASAMEKARLAQEAKGPVAYIPKEKAVAPAPLEDTTILPAKKKKPQKPKRAKKAAA